MTIEEVFRLIGVYGFPTVLSIYLIIRLDHYLKETLKTNTSLATTISNEIKDLNIVMSNIRSDLSRK